MDVWCVMEHVGKWYLVPIYVIGQPWNGCGGVMVDAVGLRRCDLRHLAAWKVWTI